MLEDLLNVSDLARMCGVPVATVYSWNHRGTGPRAIRVGKYVRYSPAEVKRWLDSNTASNAA